MEFNFDISDVLPKPIAVYSSGMLPTRTAHIEKITTIINELGLASAKAQQLKGPITTIVKLKHNPDQRLYIMRGALVDVRLKREGKGHELHVETERALYV
jgi:GNAT acetyltransferase, Mec-17